MRNKRQTGHSLYGLTALLLFGVFAGCLLSVLLSGADAYGRLVDRDQDAYAQRTCVQYLSNRVRQAVTPEGIEVTSFGGKSCLALPETIGGEEYVTRVYCHDGWMRELFTPKTGDFSPEDGEKLLEVKGLTFSRKDGLLTVRLVDRRGEVLSWVLSLHRGGEAAA